jgi:type-F conjugative transfer system pilin assembly protein TrbC
MQKAYDEAIQFVNRLKHPQPNLITNGASCPKLSKVESQQQKPLKNRVFVFVSFSMPKESLQSLLKEAQKYNATLIIRGLYKNSFKETAAILKGFDCQSEGMEINPELFDRFKITHVPVFVQLHNNQEQARLSGNVPLSFAVEKLGENHS